MRQTILLFLFFSVSILSAQDRESLRKELITAATPFEQLGELFRQNAEFAGPAVVHIAATQIRSVTPGRSARAVKMQVEETGSGVICNIADKQVIITNRHVVAEIELDAIQILTRDRRILTPKNVITNEDFDLAVIEIGEPLPISATFGDSSKVGVGDLILVIGSPFGLDQSLSMGIVSATGRRNIPGTGGTASGTATPRVPFFQIDAAVNPGSSGGPMLNLRGEVVGLITAIATQGGGNEGIAFVMPGKTVLRIAEQLVKTGSVVKPYVGLGFDPSFSIAERRQLGIDRLVGAKIKTVESTAPAGQAGLKTGDVILTFGDTEVEDDLHIVHLVAEADANQPVKLKVNRNGQTLDLTVTPKTQLSR